jgi:hypothetical protein
MPNRLDRIGFLREPTRLAIAELCRDEALTLAEIASELQRRPGSLSQPKTMLTNGALLPGPRRNGADGRGGGSTYRLNPDWEAALDEARRGRAPTWPEARQDLLLIPLLGSGRAMAALASAMPAEIEWGARVHGGMSGLILAPSPDDGGGSTIRVVDALSGAVPEILELHLSKIMAPAELRAWCAAQGPAQKRLGRGA